MDWNGMFLGADEIEAEEVVGEYAQEQDSEKRLQNGLYTESGAQGLCIPLPFGNLSPNERSCEKPRFSHNAAAYFLRSTPLPVTLSPLLNRFALINFYLNKARRGWNELSIQGRIIE